MKSVNNPTRPWLSPTQRNFLLDGLLLGGSLLALSPALTGLAIHEWLSVGLGLALLLHLLWHWDWTVAVLRRLFARIAASSRLNLVLNSALFVAFSVAVFSGLMISRVVLPGLGLEPQHSSTWRGLHAQSADLVLVLVGFHLALHWKWIFRVVRKYVLAPWPAFGQTAHTRALPTAVAVVVREQVQR